MHSFVFLTDYLPPLPPFITPVYTIVSSIMSFLAQFTVTLGFLTYLSRKEGAQQDESHSSCPIKSKQTKTLFIANLINNKPNTLTHTHTHTRGVKNLRTFKCFCCGCANLRAKRGERPEEDQPQQKRPPALGAPKGCGDI